MNTQGIPQQSADTALGGFAELGISAPVVAALEKIGFLSPTPIQAAQPAQGQAVEQPRRYWALP